ncbi:MAG: dihydrolipoamide succinyltransferase [Deltaproteobacteria bacterium]|nr:MAG: dihydrolipoamide succinyltransferase [Deltaproteobacteria bacterium]RLC16283.1 MAG: dihydrolipoamide succinyltransferase [Deltaproteobacteria bacterium]
MSIDIKIPSVGESVQEAVLAEWFKKDGETIQKDEALLVIETDKVTLEVVAEVGGVLKILIKEGETVAIGAVVGQIETAGVATKSPTPESAPERSVPPETKADAPEEEPAIPKPALSGKEVPVQKSTLDDIPLSPSVRRLVAEKNLDVSKISGTGPGGRISKGDVLLYLEEAPAGIPEKMTTQVCEDLSAAQASEEVKRVKMSPIRKRIAERLLESKQNTAMLTTFNEIDMQQAMDMRGRYKEAFKKKHEVSLGFMSFFIKACVEALKEIPEINAFVDGSDFVYHPYQHIGVAIGSDRGLVVPVIRHAERLSFAGIEKAIIDYVGKIKDNRLELADLEGGTFTVSNGGVYGSLLSTPILNTPQSGILGMHKIEKRPVVVNDEIVVRPMMYVALSYDHRIVDGKGAVTFLKRVKEFVENPERIVLEV